MISHQFWKLPKKIPLPELTLTNVSWFFSLNSVIFLTYKSRKKSNLTFLTQIQNESLITCFVIYVIFVRNKFDFVSKKIRQTTYVRFQHFITQVKFKQNRGSFFVLTLFSRVFSMMFSIRSVMWTFFVKVVDFSIWKRPLSLDSSGLYAADFTAEHTVVPNWIKPSATRTWILHELTWLS